VAVEDVVGGEVDEQCARGPRLVREETHGIGVDGKRSSLVVLRGVDVRIGGGIDDDVGLRLSNEAGGGSGGGEIAVGMLGSDELTDAIEFDGGRLPNLTSGTREQHARHAGALRLPSNSARFINIDDNGDAAHSGLFALMQRP
jgi:hypothetical protein